MASEQTGETNLIGGLTTSTGMAKDRSLRLDYHHLKSKYTVIAIKNKTSMLRLSKFHLDVSGYKSRNLVFIDRRQPVPITFGIRQVIAIPSKQKSTSILSRIHAGNLSPVRSTRKLTTHRCARAFRCARTSISRTLTSWETEQNHIHISSVTMRPSSFGKTHQVDNLYL